MGQASTHSLMCGPSGSCLQVCSRGGSHQAVDIGALGVSGWSWVRLWIATEFVNLVPKEYLAFAGAIKPLGKGQRSCDGPGQEVKAFNSGKGQPSLPRGGSPGSDQEPQVPPEAYLQV